MARSRRRHARAAALHRARRALPVLALGKPQTNVVLEPQQDVAVGHRIEVLGLQLPVSWYQSGPLELALYIPYKLTVRPK